MTLSELTKGLAADSRGKALKAALTASKLTAVYSASGSAAAVMLSLTGRRHPMLVVGDSLDDA
jgi:hypothetical protein